MKYKVMIIEDELLARKRLKLLLQDHLDVIEIIAEADNGYSGLEKINEYEPDMIFLDIQMPGLNGFEMLNCLDKIPLIIFTTAYDEFALKAFETNAIDYLLKPVTKERMKQAINKLVNITGKEKEYEDKILSLIKKIQLPETSYIKVKTGAKTRLISHNDIYFLESEDKYTCLYTKDKRYMINETLSFLEKSLSPQFKRIHRATIINIEKVKEIVHLSSHKSIVIMNNAAQSELTISRRMRKSIL